MIQLIGGFIGIIGGNIIFYFQSLRTLNNEVDSNLEYTMLDFSDDFRSYNLSILLVGLGTYFLVDIEQFKTAGFLLTISSCLLAYLGYHRKLLDPWKSSTINRWYAVLVFVQLVFGITMLVVEPGS